MRSNLKNKNKQKHNDSNKNALLFLCISTHSYYNERLKKIFFFIFRGFEYHKITIEVKSLCVFYIVLH